VSICATIEEGGVNSQRESTVYTSDSSSLDVVLVTGANKENHNFLLQVHGTKVFLSFATSIRVTPILSIVLCACVCVCVCVCVFCIKLDVNDC